MEQPIREGDMLAGKYRVERVLGEGGMGVVVAAWHLELDERVAIKFLLPEHVERGDSAERFRREARAAVKIKSNHVARVSDVGTLENGVPYMVMEFLEGHDLSEELERRGHIPYPEAVAYVLQAAEALAEAHALSIVHRDLKPANLFLAERPDGQRIIKVLDFGISKSLSTNSDLQLTKTSALIGSPLYMSPEQMDSAKDVDQRTDIWALGAVLYELLTGRPPYTGQSIPQLCNAILNEIPEPLTAIRPELPVDIDPVVQRCLAKKVEDRFQDISQLAQALEPFAPAESVLSIQRVQRTLFPSRPDNTGPFYSMLPSGARPALSDSKPSLSDSKPSLSDSKPSEPIVVEPVKDRRATDPTQASWGSTGETQASASRGPLWAAAGALLVLAVGGAILGFGGLGSSNATTPAAAATSPATEPASAAVPPPEQPPAVPAEVPAQPEPSAEGSAQAEEPASAPAQAPKAPPPGAAQARPAPRPAAPKPEPKPEPKPPGSMPDFGGRR